ncbi:hypothetical protein ASF48_09545 [Rathayibacter sp. Leaf299]|uniref:HNH endonuclease signature motif containing protein n=1 Tax=Rathayibacter sp. Leaf299 TaxID=1736328 RepID=UPI0006FF8154|nr:HNH endonuclease signature motif containing protein [Rathayibacter sp. Leaf299]KQQ20821.1 hypothetical protein ASF48_09545 [Rathayibacter sp. Leaf299]
MATIDPYTAPSEGVPSVNACFEEAYGGAIDAAGALRRFRGRIDGEQAELIELSRRLAMAVPEALVDAGVLGRGERIEAAARAHVAEIATSFRLSEAHAGALVEESRLLVNELPATLAALKEGACAAEHARVVVAEAATVPPEARGRFDEEAAVLAASCTPPQLRRRLRALRERLHPETLRERHRRCREDRAVWVDGELDGMATLHLYLPAQDAFGAYDRIDRAARSVREAGSGATPAERDVRNLRQVRADVATALLLDGETVTAPEEPDGTRNPLAERPRAAVPRGIRAVVAVTVPVLTLLGRSDEPAILDGYGPVDAQTARELAASAPSLTRILTDPHTGATLGVGRRSYRPPAELRKALAHRDETCRFPGCLRTARTADLDHTVPWQHGGATDAANLAHLCASHHRLRHLSTWSPENLGDGGVRWRSPAGRVLTVEPPGPPLPGSPPSGPPLSGPLLPRPLPSSREKVPF